MLLMKYGFRLYVAQGILGHSWTGALSGRQRPWVGTFHASQSELMYYTSVRTYLHYSIIMPHLWETMPSDRATFLDTIPSIDNIINSIRSILKT